MLPILQQKLRVMGLVGSLSTTILILQVVCLQYISISCKSSTSGLEYPVIFNNTLTNLIVLDLREDHLA